MGKVDSLKICGECGAHCCKYGGTTATKEEVDKIVHAGFKNNFLKISDNAYITEWGEDGICPYLNDKVCSIHKIRPLLCRCFPLFKAENNNALFIQHCPLSGYLTKKEIEESKELLKIVPAELINASNEYNKRDKRFEEVLLKRFKRYKVERIN